MLIDENRLEKIKETLPKILDTLDTVIGCCVLFFGCGVAIVLTDLIQEASSPFEVGGLIFMCSMIALTSIAVSRYIVIK